MAPCVMSQFLNADSKLVIATRYLLFQDIDVQTNSYTAEVCGK